MKNRSANSRKFTLIELLVVIAIIAILASILMPALQQARQRGQGAGCLSNLKDLGMACQNYMDDYNGWLPRTAFSFPGSGGSSVLDMFGRRSIAVNANEGWFVYMSTASTNHSTVSKTLPRLKYIPSDTSVAKGILICPADPNPLYGTKTSSSYSKFKLSYVINSGVCGGSYNPKDQTNWLHINDFARIVDIEPKRGPARRGPEYYPLILDGGNARDQYTYKTFFAKSAHSVAPAPNAAALQDPTYWQCDVYTPSGIGARHNACVNTVFVDGHNAR